VNYVPELQYELSVFKVTSAYLGKFSVSVNDLFFMKYNVSIHILCNAVSDLCSVEMWLCDQGSTDQVLVTSARGIEESPERHRLG
jgi:hypothetical protein